MRAFGLVLLWVALSACTKEIDPNECSSVCGRLAELLQKERISQQLDEVEGLQPDSGQGRHNIERCTADCVAHSNEEQLKCLKASQTLEDWKACP